MFHGHLKKTLKSDWILALISAIRCIAILSSSSMLLLPVETKAKYWNQLHLLALTSKTSTYNMYRMLEKSTENTGDLPKLRYLALSCRRLAMLLIQPYHPFSYIKPDNC